MAIVAAGFSFLLSMLFVPFMMLLLSIIFLASIGKSLGVRRLYVKVLLMIFEYGKKDIEIAQNEKRKYTSDSEDEGYSEEGDVPTLYTKNKPQIEKSTALKPNGLTNGHVVNGGNNLISREDRHILLPDPVNVPMIDHKSEENDIEEEFKERQEKVFNFQLCTILDYTKAGMEAIIEDQVTSRFETEELKNWNLLIRTNRGYEFISWKLTFIWLCGFFVRYFFLLPLRVTICFCGVMLLLVTTPFIGFIPPGILKRWVHSKIYMMAFRIIIRSVSAVIRIHNRKWRPQGGAICVANHTSPIDIAVLSVDGCYSLIGQRHGGFLGILQRALARASPHIWFERSEVRDKKFVVKRLKEHTSDPKNPPILIFPEGTCINNTSVMQFKKGSFEVGSVIYPVAIKYDARFGDAFWNSSKYSMLHYLYMMMTSWAIVCDVWYLPPMQKKEGESSIDFANRVKSAIAKQGGLVDLVWDGQLKRYKAKKEWKERQQEEFSKRLKVKILRQRHRLFII
ncbi:glycerol-3-phosphate acyltransferase 3 isoform X2 [Sitophilus oryzae]|uniref:Glycerol-3-phosphate acyltransferase 3 isoform X2 n=1 Tax=Sitophilus oryzae TaxID=7048 RepID=A0A6J2XKD0_SITOR|nr:glycerol-3-phosphate acyltransferase 3 isoform X2 [Sitophilus oryzae]